jgi:ribosomal protein L16/L10AE
MSPPPTTTIDFFLNSLEISMPVATSGLTNQPKVKSALLITLSRLKTVADFPVTKLSMRKTPHRLLVKNPGCPPVESRLQSAPGEFEYLVASRA